MKRTKLAFIALVIALVTPLILNAQHLRTMAPARITAPHPKPVRFGIGTSAATPTISASIYIDSPDGLYSFTANSFGVVTPSHGVQKIQGMLAAANATAIITMDTTTLYAFTVGEDGALGQFADADTTNFPGTECGVPVRAVLDAATLYVQLSGAIDPAGDTICDAIQTYTVDSRGFTFLGDTDYDSSRFAEPATQPALTQAYAFDTTLIPDACEQDFNSFTREQQTRALDVFTAPLTQFPTPDPMGGGYFPLMAIGNDKNSLAVAVQQDYAPPCGATGEVQLAMFTVTANGELVSADTWQTMPTVGEDIEAMALNPAGSLLAVGGEGLEVFNFAPGQSMTPFTTKILAPSAGVSALGWDNSANLYAWGIDADGQFKVFSFNSSSGQIRANAPQVVAANSTGMAVVAR